MLRDEDPRLVEQRLREVAVSPLEGPHERALFLPAFPQHRLFGMLSGAIIMAVKVVGQEAIRCRLDGQIAHFSIVQARHQG